jgi:hypothetical protein
LIPADLTEKVTANTTIQFISYVSISSSISGKSAVRIVIEPFANTTLGNFSNSYRIYPVDGLSLFPAFFFPECPNMYGPVAVPASINLGCNLYDAKNNLIKALPGCSIKPNEVVAGLIYSIKYNYIPNPIQPALKGTINVTTIYQPAKCSIANASLTYVRTNGTLGLKVSLTNSRTAFKFNWVCKPLSSGASCGIQSTLSNTPDLSLPASTLTQNSLYEFTLEVTENSILQANCSARVEVVPQTPYEMYLQLLEGNTTSTTTTTASSSTTAAASAKNLDLSAP